MSTRKANDITIAFLGTGQMGTPWHRVDLLGAQRASVESIKGTPEGTSRTGRGSKRLSCGCGRKRRRRHHDVARRRDG